MPHISDVVVPQDIYDECLNEDTTLDLSARSLEAVPEIKNNLLCVLYLQNNKLETLPDDFFPTLPSLMWLDLRDNRLRELPKSIKNHPSLTHLLLQNNCLTALPNELGTVSLKVLQLADNPLIYPSKEVINDALPKLLKFLHDRYIDQVFANSQSDLSVESYQEPISPEGQSYNSVIDEAKIKTKNLVIQFNEKDKDEMYYSKLKGKCPKLSKSRYRTLPSFWQSAKYLKPAFVGGVKEQEEKIRQNYIKDLAIKKQKELLAKREKILQNRKSIAHLKNWRHDYRYRQCFTNPNKPPTNYPYDTNPEYMTLLSREDIEKELPDKYRKSILRRSKPTVPRKNNNDVHLAMKIKQLFENLEAIDLNREGMTPRTEQKVLLNEIQKITEIKQKLMELSNTNQKTL